MIRPDTISTITKKELRTYFDSPTAYIVLTVFLLLWQFLFFRNAFLINEASLRQLMVFVPWLFIILIPAITMGSISAEKSDGTLELLLTHPVSALELILSKFFAALIFVAVGLLFMFPIAFSFSRFGQLDWGVVVGQYFASVMMASVFVSLGLFISSLLNSQISALLVSAAASFLLTIVGFELVTVSLPATIAPIVERLSVLDHFDSMARGVIDIRDIWYFVSASAIFLSLAYLQLLKLRVGNQKQTYQSYITGVTLFIGIAILINIIGARIPGRLDLTKNKAYQLTNTTKETLESLDDVVTIKLFASSELPAQLRPILRDTKDILRDYQTSGLGKVQLTTQDPGRDNQALQDANSLGVREVQFNVIGQEELQLKKGYLGLAVQYGSKTEILPLVSDTSGLEYELTSFIKKLTTPQKSTIAFISGHGEKSPQAGYTIFATELEKLYQTQILDLSDPNAQSDLSQDLAAVIVAGPTTALPEEQQAAISDFFDNGGSVLMLLDGVNINQQILNASVNEQSLGDFTQTFGVQLDSNLVYDLRSNETVNFGGGNGVSFVVRYPFWPRVIAADTSSPISKSIPDVIFPWPSSLSLDETVLSQKNLEATKLYSTTQFGGTQSGLFNISPDSQILPTQLGEQLVAVSLKGPENEQGKLPRMVITGDSDFLTDDFAGSNPQNLGLGLEMVNWLAQADSLSEIQLKQRNTPQLVFADQTQASLVKFGNLGLAVVLPVIFGTSRLMRRRNLRNLKYS